MFTDKIGGLLGILRDLLSAPKYIVIPWALERIGHGRAPAKDFKRLAWPPRPYPVEESSGLLLFDVEPPRRVDRAARVISIVFTLVRAFSHNFNV